MLFQHSSYRSYLRQVLVSRIEKNPRYSLRAMASHLGLNPSYLSEVMKAKKNLSAEKALHVGGRLGLEGVELEYFQVLVQAEGTVDPKLKGALYDRAHALNPEQHVQNLDVDFFKLISDWYHLPIRQLASLPNFDFTAKNVSRRLGISVAETETAIERLLRLELIERDPCGRIRKTDSNLLVRSAVPNDALRKFHRQMLAIAAESLETQPVGERFIGTHTLPFDRKLLKKAEAIIEECFSRIGALGERCGSPRDVYHLGIQFFNLTSEKRKTL